MFNVEVTIRDKRFEEEIQNIEDECRKIAVMSWDFARREKYFLPEGDVEVSIVLTDDREIKEINRNYRDRDNPTNVMSFASLDSEEPEDKSGIFFAGDIIISYDTMKKEAIKTSLKEYFAHLLVHGMMHLAGFDHMEEDEAEKMEAIEAEILAELGIKNPYEDE